MNASHWHLMLNHFPVTGLLLGLCLWGLALRLKQPELDRLVRLWFVLMGLLVVPVYLSGQGSHDMLHDFPGIPHERIETHADWGNYTLFALLGLAAVAVAGLIRKAAFMEIVFPLLVAVGFAVSLYTAHLGGLIRHPEIQPGFVPSPAPQADLPDAPHGEPHEEMPGGTHPHPEGMEHHH